MLKSPHPDRSEIHQNTIMRAFPHPIAFPRLRRMVVDKGGFPYGVGGPLPENFHNNGMSGAAAMQMAEALRMSKGE